MALSLERINRARQAGYGDDEIVESISRNDPSFGERIQRARDAGYDSSAIMQSIEKRLSSSPEFPDNSNFKKTEIREKEADVKPRFMAGDQNRELKPTQPNVLENTQSFVPQKDQSKGLLNSFSKGLRESASGELAKRVFSDQEKEQAAQDPTFWEQLVQSAGTITGDAPYIVAGTTLGGALGATLGSVGGPPGSALGGAVGGAFGSLAMPAFIKEALKEYRQFQEQGNDLTFGEFLSSADRVASKTLKEGAFGVILGAINKAMPFLRNVPGIGSLFNSKIAQKGAALTAETVAAGTIPPIAEGRLPEANDYAQAAALIFGLNALKLPKVIKEKIQKSGEASGMTPEEFAKSPEVQELINEVVKKPETPSEVPVEQPKSEANKKTEASKEKANPIIETTGEGAEKRIEYVQDRLNENVDKANALIEAAKNPKESLSRLGHATNTAIFNFMAPLEKAESSLPTGERVSTRIKLAQSAASEINSVLENGIFSNITGQFEHEGLKGAYGDLTWKRLNKGLKPEEYSVQDLDTYRASRVALRRQREGKETGIDTAKAQADVKRLHQKYGPIDQRIREYNQKVLEFYGKDLIGKEKIEEWNKQYYAPLYRVMEAGNNPILRPGSLQPKQPFKKFKGSGRKIIAPSESDPYNTSMLISNAKKNDAVLQYKRLVDKGQLPGKVRKVKGEKIPPEVQKELRGEDIDIDPALDAVAENVYNQTRKDSFTPRKNILRGWENGKPFEIEVPDDIYNVFSSLAPQDRGSIAKFFAASNRIFSRGISLSPHKFASIAARDALSSLVYSRTGYQPMSIFSALGDIYKDNKIYKEFLSMGGDVYAARLAGRIDRAKKIEEFVTPESKGPMFGLDKIGDFFKWYSDLTSNLSMAVPLAEYKRALAKYGESAEGRLMASMEARSVTYDPTRKGAWKVVQELNNYIPFWNVSLQELSMVGSSLKNNPSAWAKGFAAITVPTLILKMLNDGNPKYQELTPQDKAAYWHVFIGDHHARIAIPWLLGTTFKVGPEFFFDLAQQRGGEAWKGLWNNFLDNLSGDIPPILQTYVEWQTNKSLPSPVASLFGGESNAPDVVPKRLQGLPAHLQYTNKTSQLARWFGDLWGISPVKLERAIKTNTGVLGAQGLALIDEIAYQTGLAEDKRPAQRESNYLLLGSWLTNSPTSRTKYANQFYEYLDESKRANAGEKMGEANPEKARFAHLSKYNQEISKRFREYRDIESSNIDAKTKKRRLDAKQIEINELYKEAVEKVKAKK